ncbi:MAG: carboxypeptidase regulatory-like domain-containing protein, partial [Terriglobales bacterium]
MRKQSAFLAIAVALCVAAWLPRLSAQSLVTGGIAGIVLDPSGAAVPNALIIAVDSGTGETHQARTDAHGNYNFALLVPATYTLTVTATGFHAVKQSVIVQLGQVTAVPLKLGLASSNQTVEVNAAAPPLLQTENGDIASTVTETQIQQLPIPGGDLNDLAQIVPGAINTGGDFPSVFGMPETSNMYRLDGTEDVDPYGHTTDGGATNLLLGINSVQEATTVGNGYSTKYGTLAGSNINMVTKSGTNNFHGNLAFHWTGENLMGNNFFNNASGTPRATSMAKQWVGSMGGPILHNKLFFFADDEGLAVVLPSSTLTFIPSAAYATATMNNINANHPASAPFYQNIFKLYAGAAGAGRATPVAQNGGCSQIGSDASGNPIYFQIPGSPSSPCAQDFYSNATNFAWENMTIAKTDWNMSPSDHAMLYFMVDRGVQSSGIDPINPVFNAISKQPEYTVNASESHTFGSNAVNALMLSVQHYIAHFGPPDLAAALQTFPTQLDFGDGSFTTLGGGDASGTEGRNVTSVQLEDDFSKTFGGHAVDFGFTGTDYLANVLISGNEYGDLVTTDQDSFFNGGMDPNNPSGENTVYSKGYPEFGEAGLRMIQFGAYVDDQWRVTPKLSLTLGIRADDAGTPSCTRDCFSGLGDFLAADHSASQPYNAVIKTGLADALPNT